VVGEHLGQRLRLRATDWTDALDRALELGRARETSYRNGDGERVDVAFTCVETLDLLDADLANGREVYAERFPLRERKPYVRDIDPAASRPTHTGV